MGGLKSFSSKKAADAAKSDSPVKRTKVENKTVVRNKNQSFMIEQALKETKNNEILPLVCSESMDTALMTLDYLAYFNDFKTANSFSIFVIKGKLAITRNGKSKIVSKGDVTIVDCISVNGAKLFLSYAL